MYMYESTGNEIYKTQADQTMWAISDKGYKVGMLQAMRAMPASERPYYINWMKETNPLEREQILEIVPEDVGNLQLS